MATYGPRSISELVMLTGWDATELKKFELADGTSYMQVVAMMNGALGTLNAELYSDPLWSSLVAYQDNPEVEYRVGSSNGFEEHTEYGRPDAKRADTEGHMLPIRPYDRMLGWTWDYLQEARLVQIEADIADAVKDARDLWRLRILARLLDRDDESGALKGLGASGYSPGFATTAASTNVDFVPPAYGGNVFTNTHEHYVAIAGGAFTADVFKDVKAELREHGHEAPYNFIIGQGDESTVAGLTGFVPTASTGIRYGTGVSLAEINPASIAPGVYPIGIIHDCWVYVCPGIPTYWGFGWKSYGMNSQRNPLRIRVPKGQNRINVVAMTDPKAGSGITPIQNLMLYTKFGVGVGDRTNGTPRYVNAANWADGTPT